MKVYLAGGMKTDWQDKLIKSINNSEITWFDPRSHKLTEPKEYTKWDLSHVAKSDLIFAYMEHSNPAGFAMCIEIGFAHSLNIPIIFVNEQSGRKWNMVNECCKYVTEDFEEGIDYLRDLIKYS